MPGLSRGEILDRVAGGESLRRASLMRADLSDLELVQIDLTEANLRMADLTYSDLREARLTRSSLSGANLNGVNLVGANMVEASLIGANLSGADLSRADLSGADLTGATLEDAQLLGAYLVGAFLNEADLSRANLSGAYVRMARMGGTNLGGAIMEGADLSQADLSGVHLDGCCLISANLAGADLSSSTLTYCDLRGADLSGANLSGCNLTGAKLRGVKSHGAKLDDIWAEWVNIGSGGNEERASLEDVFGGRMGKPLAQMLVEGSIDDKVWVVLLAHLCKFQMMHPRYADVKLKAIRQNANASALYLEADQELSLAAYLFELAGITGKGHKELADKLIETFSDQIQIGLKSNGSALRSLPTLARSEDTAPRKISGSTASSDIEALKHTAFWNSEKAFAILTSSRCVCFEAASNETLTIRSPHSFNPGIELIQGHFVSNSIRR